VSDDFSKIKYNFQHDMHVLGVIVEKVH